jgi:hypothetical protein
VGRFAMGFADMKTPPRRGFGRSGAIGLVN